MTPQVIQFQCTHCGSPLTVPANLAGVTGPCPKCGQNITSPAATDPAASIPVPSPLQYTPPVQSVPPAFIQPPAESPAPPAASLPAFPQAPTWTPPPAASPGFPAPAGETVLPASKPATALDPKPSLLRGFHPTPVDPATSMDSAGTHPTQASGMLAGAGAFPQRSPEAARQTEPAPAEAHSLLNSVLSPIRVPEAAPTAGFSGNAEPAPPLSPIGIDPTLRLPNRSPNPLPPFPNRPGKGSNLVKLGIAALLLIGCLGLIAYAAKAPLTDLYYRHVAPLLVASETADPSQPPAAVESSAETPSSKPPGQIPAAVSLVEDSPAPSPAPEALPAPPTPPVTALSTSTPPQIDPPSDGVAGQNEVIQKAMPALPEDPLAVNAPSKGSLMEVPSDISPLDNPGALPNSTASLTTLAEIPDEAKPAANALIDFLNAETLEQKRKFILGAEDPQMTSHIERYYGQAPAAPIPVSSIGFIRHDPNPEVGGGMQSVFMVASPEWKYPVPVMVQETKAGHKLDWIAFIEFKDNWLLKFVQGYHPNPGRFHISLKRSHYFDRDVPDLENKDCFLAQPPQEDFEVAVFVDKNSPLAEMLRRELTWSSQYAYVLAEIQWRDDGTNQWVELTAVPQLNWYITTEPDSSSEQ